MGARYDRLGMQLCHWALEKAAPGLLRSHWALEVVARAAPRRHWTQSHWALKMTARLGHLSHWALKMVFERAVRRGSSLLHCAMHHWALLHCTPCKDMHGYSEGRLLRTRNLRNLFEAQFFVETAYSLIGAQMLCHSKHGLCSNSLFGNWCSKTQLFRRLFVLMQRLE